MQLCCQTSRAVSRSDIFCCGNEPRQTRACGDVAPETDVDQPHSIHVDTLTITWISYWQILITKQTAIFLQNWVSAILRLSASEIVRCCIDQTLCDQRWATYCCVAVASISYLHVQGLVHLNLTSMGFCCITDLLLPRANNFILFMSIQPARNPLGKFVEHWWRHKRSTVKQAKICSQLPS